MSEVYISLSGLVISNGPYEHMLPTGSKLYDVGFQFRVTVQQTSITKADLDRVVSFVERGSVLMEHLEEICELGRRKPESVLPCQQLHRRHPQNSAQEKELIVLDDDNGVKSTTSSASSQQPTDNKKVSMPTSSGGSVEKRCSNKSVCVLEEAPSNGNATNKEVVVVEQEGRRRRRRSCGGAGNEEAEAEVMEEEKEEEDEEEEEETEDVEDLERFCTEFGATEELEKMRVEDIIIDTNGESVELNGPGLFAMQRPKGFEMLDFSEQLRCSLERLDAVQSYERKFASSTDPATSPAKVPAELMGIVPPDVLVAAKDIAARVKCPPGLVPSLVVVPVSVCCEQGKGSKQKPEKKPLHMMTRSEAKILEDYYRADATTDKRGWVSGAMKAGLRGVQVRELGRRLMTLSGAKATEKDGGGGGGGGRDKKRSGRPVLRKAHREFLLRLLSTKAKSSVGDARQLLEERFPELRGKGDGEHLVSLPLLYCTLKSLCGGAKTSGNGSPQELKE